MKDRTLRKKKFTRAEMINSLAKRYEKVVIEINVLVNDIREQVSMVDPLNLLHRGYFCNVQASIGKKSESEYSAKDGIAARMVDYIQNVIVSTAVNVENPEIENAAWERLRDSVTNLFFKLNGEYHITRTAWLQQNDKEYDFEIDRLLFMAQLEWVFVRGKRYDIHESQHLADFMTPHDEVIQQLFGISVNDFVLGIEKIKKSLTFGFPDAFREMLNIQGMIEEKISNRNIPDEEKDAVIFEIVENNGWGEQIASLHDKLYYYELFNVSTISGLPSNLLRELSWETGENQEFFAPGEYSGWPFRELPIMSRPFIWINNEAYCFDMFFLDNIYRNVQKLILRLQPDYRETWNNKQKEVSEKVPMELLKKIWPTAIRYSSIHYRWKSGSPQTMQWCECDGLLIFDDHILVLEIKAGAFTHTSPSIDPKGFIASIRNLGERPAQQGKRFVEYLNSAAEVNIYDHDHTEIATLQRKSFRNITICCITLDDFTTFAARIENLIPFGITIEEPVWCISIDNLRVYEDLFKSPTMFSHFLEERKKAFRSKAIDLDDELDHLGLYLEHNDYATTAEELSKKRNATVMWHGYRDDIDAYYHDLLEGQLDVAIPSQKLPRRITEIIKLLDEKDKPGRCQIASVLLGMNGATRIDIGDKIEEVLTLQPEKMRMLPITILVGQKCITFFCRQMQVICMSKEEMIDHAVKSLLCTSGDESLAIFVEYDGDLNAQNIAFEFINKHEIPSERMDEFNHEVEIIKSQRWGKRMQLKGDVGRNERCPCGSGKKYKYCCLKTK